MPELPEVENFKRYFKRTALNKEIVDIECRDEKLIKGISLRNFRNRLIGKSFKGASRRGKFLIIDIRNAAGKLVIHFGMTGGFYYLKSHKGPGGEDRFSRLIFKFKDKSQLHWLNMRKFGKVYLVKDPKEIALIREMGPEPLGLSEAKFGGLLRGHNKNIKAFLLNQRDIAGIGNLYSDEILFRTRINPRRKIETLNPAEEAKIYQAMVKILKAAIQTISASGRFASSWLLSHRGEDMRCPRNRIHRLKRETIAGRSGIYCPACQR